MGGEKRQRPWNRSLRARLVGHFLLLSLLIVALAVPTVVFGLLWSPLKTLADQSLAYLLGG